MVSLITHGVAVEARGVAQLAVDDDRVQLGGLDGALLVLLGPEALLSHAHARPQVDALRPEC
jgi:hypothetical protein